MDLSKTFDTIDHDLSIAKLYAYRFSSYELLISYMMDCWQRSKINKLLSSWSAFLLEVLQGLVLGLMLFNIYLNDLFYFLFCDASNFADDTTSYVRDKNLAFVLAKLEENSNIAMKWFENNYMKMNSGKCHLFISG